MKKLVACLAAATILLVACGKDEISNRYDDPGKPAYGDTLITSSIGEASNLIPILATDGASHDIAREGSR